MSCICIHSAKITKPRSWSVDTHHWDLESNFCESLIVAVELLLSHEFSVEPTTLTLETSSNRIVFICFFPTHSLFVNTHAFHA